MALEKLEQLRIREGLTRKQMNIIAGLSENSEVYSNYLKKDTLEGIELYRIKKWADYFGTSLDYLLVKETPEDEIITEYLYIKDSVEKIEIRRLTLELKKLINESNIEGKKYLIDSYEIGLKLWESNIL